MIISSIFYSDSTMPVTNSRSRGRVLKIPNKNPGNADKVRFILIFAINDDVLI
jgi:hypothetical protein